MGYAHKHITLALGLLAGAMFAAACSSNVEKPRDTAVNADRRRGCALIFEVNWAGSMKNNGQYDPDDDFLEIMNVDCNKPIDLAGWWLIMDGDIKRTFVVPAGPNTVIAPNQVGVIIGKANGAFRDQGNPDYKPIVLPGFFIPERHWTIETKTAENFLIENAINTLHGPPLSGAFDSVTTRSMQRSQDRFEDETGAVSSWFSASPCNENSPSLQAAALLGNACTNTNVGASGRFVHADYALRTFATPGEENTPDYR